MPHRFAARQGKQDANAPAIARALRQCGASVVDLHAVGGGCPDLLVGFRGNLTVLMEVKTAAGKVRESQEEFAVTWRGWPVVVVRNEVEALSAIGISCAT